MIGLREPGGDSAAVQTPATHVLSIVSIALYVVCLSEYPSILAGGQATARGVTGLSRECGKSEKELVRVITASTM